jgi:hypothetical protein
MPFVVGAFVVLGCVWAARDDHTGAWIFWILAPVALVVGVRRSLTIATGTDRHSSPRGRVNAEGLGGDAGRGAYGARWIEQTIERVHDRWQSGTQRLRSDAAVDGGISLTYHRDIDQISRRGWVKP